MDIIREDFFHFLWENIHFSLKNLKTTAGDTIRVVHPGHANNGDGPDYRLAQIRWNGILFYGDIELHLVASDWYKHGHHRDSRYERVILHVVARDDLYPSEAGSSDGQNIPTLELRSVLPHSLARLWRAWHRPAVLPCSGLIREIAEPEFIKIIRKWDQRYFRHRLDRMLLHYPENRPMGKAWMHMLICGIFQGLGYHKNQENMVRLAGYCLSSGMKTGILEQRNDDSGMIHDLAGRLLILSGLQPPSSGNDANLPVLFDRSEWDFSASRPSNQPETRVRQAAELFGKLLQTKTNDWLQVPVDRKWNAMCRLDHAPPLGKDRSRVIFYNVVLPSVHLLACWLYHNKVKKETETHWSAQSVNLPGKPVKVLKNSGFPEGEHFKKLALLHQFKYYCTPRRCSACEVMKVLVRT